MNMRFGDGNLNNARDFGQGVMSQHTLTLTNYSKLELNVSRGDKDPPMPLTLDSPKAASDSASVNKAVLYSENSIYQLFSSLDQSKRDESILRGL